MKSIRGVDFSLYRPRTIGRRAKHRLMRTGQPDYDSYLRYLLDHPEEMDALISTLTIKVSAFFRDPLVFEVLSATGLPELLTSFSGKTIRVWSPGCARGEELYSLAILLREACLREGLEPQVFMLGTDIDREAIEEARQARYEPSAVMEVKKGLLDKYFLLEDGLYSVKEEIKTLVRFTSHDLTSCSSPMEGIFSDYHLILYRNLLMYFERETQEKILRSLCAAIPAGGFLVLGKAETLPDSLCPQFSEYMAGTKIFRKKKV